MTWSGQWSIQIDGHELNSITTGGPYATTCPELRWVHEQDVKFVPIDGDYPAYVGMQPREGNYTLLIQMKAVSDAVWETQLAQLQSWLTPGQHVLTFQVRGMAAAKSVTVIARSVSDEYKAKRVTSLLTAAKPVPV